MIGEIDPYKNLDMNISEEENQSTEWKWSWNDDFLKWLCGYANTDGGILYVGVNDDGYRFRFLYLKIILNCLMWGYGLKAFLWMMHYIKDTNPCHITRKLRMCFIGREKLNHGGEAF